MIILKIIIGIGIFLVIPELLGMLFTRFLKANGNVLFNFILGYIFEFASFELIYIPMMFLDKPFKLLTDIWVIFILICCLISIILNFTRFKDIFINTKDAIKSFSKIIIVFLIIMIIQIYFPMRYMQKIDPDEAFYVALSTTTLEENSLFKVNPYDGTEYKDIQWRYCFSGLPFFYSAVSQVIGIHPAILQHTIWPAIAIILEYSVYLLIANKLFDKDKEKISYFMIILSVIHMFGYISIYSNFSFFAYRSWQGKALIANLIIPLVWYMYLNCIENNKKILYWVLFFILMIASCFITELSVFIIPIEVGVLSILYSIQNKEFLNSIISLCCCIPQLAIGIVYLIFTM